MQLGNYGFYILAISKVLFGRDRVGSNRIKSDRYLDEVLEELKREILA